MGMQTPSFLGVSSQLTLETAGMTFWDQGIPEEALVISCPLCYSTCGAPFDPWLHGRIILIFLMAKEFCLFAFCSRLDSACCLLLAGMGSWAAQDALAKLGSFQRWDNLIF